MRRSIGSLLLLLCLLASPVQAQEDRVWRVCVSDANTPPWLTNDASRPGLYDRILMAAGREVGFSTLIVRYPTPRCRKMMIEGDLDAELFAPTPVNRETFRFPMKGGEVDESRRIGHMNIVFVKRPESPFDWTSAGLVGAKVSDLLIGTRASVRVAIEPLEAAGFKVDSTAMTASQLLLKLDKQRVDMAVTLQEEVELSMQDTRLKALVILPRPLTKAVYYMAVHKNLPADQQAKVEAWWNAIAKYREMPEYRPN